MNRRIEITLCDKQKALDEIVDLRETDP